MSVILPLNAICPGLIEENIKSDLELWMLGAILSSVAYGGVLTLTLSYLPILLKSSYDISRRMRIFLLAYVMFMFAISTLYIITIIIGLTMLVNGSKDNCSAIVIGLSPGWLGLARAICIAFANWGADGFMLWRCAMLYEGVSRPLRILLLSVLGFMGLISLGSGLALLFSISNIGFFFFLAMIGMTIILNLVTATLITFRILYFDRYIRKTVGLERNGPYMTVIILCIESSAIVIVFSSIFLALVTRTLTHNPFEPLIPLQLLVHLYVISPLLIVYRVARGKAANIRRRSLKDGPVPSALYFAPLPPSSNDNEAQVIIGQI